MKDQNKVISMRLKKQNMEPFQIWKDQMKEL